MIVKAALKPVLEDALQYMGNNEKEVEKFSNCTIELKNGRTDGLVVYLNHKTDVISKTDWLIKTTEGFQIKTDDEFRELYYICE